MKKLLKSDVCESREQCTDALFTGEMSKVPVLKKKKNVTKTQMCVWEVHFAHPKRTLNSPNFYFIQFSSPIYLR